MLPVSEKSMDYAAQVAEKLRDAGVRCVLDDRNEKIGYKIREARQEDKAPYMIIVGEKEVAEGIVSVRDRDTDQTAPYSYDDFEAKVLKEIKERA